MKFEWDENKNRINRKKQGIWFEEAQTAFADDYSRVFFDGDHSDDEDRYILIGMSSSRRLLLVVHCYRERDGVVRIISARKATRKERGVYEEGI